MTQQSCVNETAMTKIEKLMRNPKPCSVCGADSAGALASAYHEKAAVNFLCKDHMPIISVFEDIEL